MIRHDFAFPFRIDAASGQAAQASYQDHVDQMIRQVLLTDPGERVCLPDLRRRTAPADVRADVRAVAGEREDDRHPGAGAWLAGQITVQNVTVDTAISDPAPAQGVIVITIAYVLIETQTMRQTQVLVI